MIRRMLAQPRPTPQERPRNPLEVSEDDAIILAKRGQKHALKEADVSSAAAHNQWRSYVRIARRNFGECCSLEPLYRKFYNAVEQYRDRWMEVQEVQKMYEDAVASGTHMKEGREGRVVRRGASPDDA